MVSGSFAFSPTPQILFGPGTVQSLAGIVADMGEQSLLLTGERSLDRSGRLDSLQESFEDAGVRLHHVRIDGEPSPELVDQITGVYRSVGPATVIAVGGGSVVDAGKAVSAMMTVEDSVLEYLEGVGSEKPHPGTKVPFVAVPTTAGTGSEATKNAVLSRVNSDGFKKSLRHDAFVPDLALIDPELMVGCPPDITAACGMDALSQLLEAYVCTGASPMTDALALSGIAGLKNNLVPACGDGAGDLEVRGGMAYAALCSGICLANAGLGLIHGVAGPLGGLFEVPHGLVCGRLLAPAVRITIDLLGLEEDGGPALDKYAVVGEMLGGERSCESLVERLQQLTEELKLPPLGEYGIGVSDIDRIVAVSGNKKNPVELPPGKIGQVLREAIGG